MIYAEPDNHDTRATQRPRRSQPGGLPAVSEPLTDSVLVQRAARGDGIAFSELVNRHHRRLLRVAFGLLKDRQDAEDVVQDAFVRAHRRLDSFEGGAAFYTWVYRITVNISIDTMRKRKRERRIDFEDESAQQAVRKGATPWPRFESSHPARHSERRELASRLQSALAALPEIHQAVLVLRELEGMSYEEIAQTLGLKRGTVMSRLFNARKAMQEKLLEMRRDDELDPTRGSVGA